MTKSYAVGSNSCGVQLVVAAEDLLLLGGQRPRVALEPVVDRLRDVEELVLAADDPPLDLEAGVGHERDERVVDLGDAAAERRRRQVEDALPRERLGEPPDLVHEPAGRDRRVVAERLVADVDEREHGRRGRSVAAGSDGQPSRSLTKRRREPRPSGPRPISNSSAIVWMIAIPSPPSVSSSPASAAAGRGRSRSPRRRRRPRSRAGRAGGRRRSRPSPRRRCRRAGRSSSGLGDRELQVGERLRVRSRTPGEPGERETRERDVLGLRRDREPDRLAGRLDPRPPSSRQGLPPFVAIYHKLPFVKPDETSSKPESRDDVMRLIPRPRRPQTRGGRSLAASRAGGRPAARRAAPRSVRYRSPRRTTKVATWPGRSSPATIRTRSSPLSHAPSVDRDDDVAARRGPRARCPRPCASRRGSRPARPGCRR